MEKSKDVQKAGSQIEITKDSFQIDSSSAQNPGQETVLDPESNELMVEIEQRLLDANKILLDINGKIKDAFLDERL